MNNKTITIAVVSSIACVAVSLIAVQLYMKETSLNEELDRSHQITQKVQNEMALIQADKDKAIAQNEKLQQDALTFVDTNSKIQQEKEKTAEMLEAAKTLLKRKEVELGQAKQELNGLRDKVASGQADTDSKLYKEKVNLEANVSALEGTLKKERGLFHYNLAVAYTKSKLFDDAIQAYEKALSFDPGNADAHYNLALLYSNVKNDTKKAIEHYKAYLDIKPDADDRDDVLELLDKLTAD